MTLSCQRTDVFVGSSERMNARREGFIEINQPVLTLVGAPQLGLLHKGAFISQMVTRGASMTLGLATARWEKIGLQVPPPRRAEGA